MSTGYAVFGGMFFRQQLTFIAVIFKINFYSNYPSDKKSRGYGASDDVRLMLTRVETKKLQEFLGD